MWQWITKTLWAQKTSVISSSAGVAAAFILVLVLDAAFVGESHQIVAYIRHANPAVWVMQKGVSNMHMATSFVWDWKVNRIAQLPGVKQATPIIYANTIVQVAKQHLFAYVMGLPPDGQRAGPWSITQGKAHPTKGEIILPQVLADTSNAKLGDKATIADRTFTIVGFSAGTFSMANSIAFVSFSDLESLLSTSGTVSFILVDAQPGQDPAELAKSIEHNVDKVSAIPQVQFIKNDFQLALLMGVEIILFMTILGSILAALILAFTLYSQVSRRRRELAIIKALGYENRSLYMAVILQSLVITGIALIMAMLVSWLLIPALSAAVPMVTLDVTTAAIMRMVVTALGISLFAALVPAYFVARVDPISAFKV